MLLAEEAVFVADVVGWEGSRGLWRGPRVVGVECCIEISVVGFQRLVREGLGLGGIHWDKSLRRAQSGRREGWRVRIAVGFEKGPRGRLGKVALRARMYRRRGINGCRGSVGGFVAR